MNSIAEKSNPLENEVVRFFSNIDAATLREDLIEYFLMYIRNKHGELPVGFDGISERLYVLIRMLKQIDTVQQWPGKPHIVSDKK